MDSAADRARDLQQRIGVVGVAGIGQLEDHRQRGRSDLREGIRSRGVRPAELRGDDRLAEALDVQGVEGHSDRSREVSDLSSA